jgi:hypothetical protein
MVIVAREYIFDRLLGAAPGGPIIAAPPPYRLGPHGSDAAEILHALVA